RRFGRPHRPGQRSAQGPARRHDRNGGVILLAKLAGERPAFRPVPHSRPRKIARCTFDEGAGSIAFFLKGTTGREWGTMGKALKLEIQTTDFTDNTDKASLLLSLILVIREIRGGTQAVCAAGAALPPRAMKTPSQLLLT